MTVPPSRPSGRPQLSPHGVVAIPVLVGLVVLTGLLAGAAPAGAQDSPTFTDQSPRQRYALVVGISDYADDAIPDLGFADADARAFAEFLRSPAAGMGGLPADHVRLLVNEDATARAIRIALSSFLGSATSDDVVYVFLAAHGVADPYRPEDLYLLPQDTEMGNVAGTAIPLDHLRDAFDGLDAHMTVVFADVSHAGSLGSARTRTAAGGDDPGGFVVFTAAGPNQVAREGEAYGGGHGIFTHYLLQGLQGAADDPEEGGDGNRVVVLGELLEYVRNRVRRATENVQVPTISATAYDRFWPMAAVMGN